MKTIRLHLVVFNLLILSSFFIFKVNAQTNLNSYGSSNNSIAKTKIYPTPDWGHLQRGKDYVPNEMIVKLKVTIQPKDRFRVIQEMSAIGKIVNHSFKKLPFSFYEVKITNGSSEKENIEKILADPAVEYASPLRIHHTDLH